MLFIRGDSARPGIELFTVRYGNHERVVREGESSNRIPIPSRSINRSDSSALLCGCEEIQGICNPGGQGAVEEIPQSTACKNSAGVRQSWQPYPRATAKIVKFPDVKFLYSLRSTPGFRFCR